MWQHAFQKASVAPVNLKSAWCEVLQCWLTHWLIRVDDIGTSVTSKQGQLRGKLDQGHWPRWRLVALGAVSLAEGPELELPRPGLPWPPGAVAKVQMLQPSFPGSKWPPGESRGCFGFQRLTVVEPETLALFFNATLCHLKCDFTLKEKSQQFIGKKTPPRRDNLPPWRKTFHLGGKPFTLENLSPWKNPCNSQMRSPRVKAAEDWTVMYENWSSRRKTGYVKCPRGHGSYSATSTDLLPASWDINRHGCSVCLPKRSLNQLRLEGDTADTAIFDA